MARGSVCSLKCVYGDEIGNLSSEKGLFLIGLSFRGERYAERIEGIGERG